MEELLQELFGLMPDGTFVDIEEFKTFIEEDGTDELFDLFKPGHLKTKNSLINILSH